MNLCVQENPFFSFLKILFHWEILTASLQSKVNSLVIQKTYSTTELYPYATAFSPHKQPEFKSNSSFHNHNGCITHHRSLSHKT